MDVVWKEVCYCFLYIFVDCGGWEKEKDLGIVLNVWVVFGKLLSLLLVYK